MSSKQRVLKFSSSIVLANFLNLEKEIQELENAEIDLIHYDVMDGHYVKNFGLNYEILRILSKYTNIPIEVHLAVLNPDEYIEEFIKSGAKIITIQKETCSHIFRTIEVIKKNNAKVCVSLSPVTPLYEIEYILNLVDMFLVMTVNPGFHAQKFIPQMIDKVRKLRIMLDENEVNSDIGVDGAISKDVIPKLVKAGANVFVLGTSSNIFKQGVDKIEVIRNLRLIAKKT